MSWKYVARQDNCGRFMHDDFAEHARTLGYRFMSWNGLIYFIGTPRHPMSIETGISAEEMF